MTPIERTGAFGVVLSHAPGAFLAVLAVGLLAAWGCP